MKTKIIGLVCLCLGFVACNEHSDKPSSGWPPPTRIEDVMVIKFTQPEYNEHILVAFPEKGEPGLSLVPTTRWSEAYALPRIVEDLYRQAPYTELLDNYLLIDWKYYRVICRVLTEQASIITNKWEEMDDLEKWWPFENMYVAYPFEEIISIPLDSLNAYNGGLKHPYLCSLVYGAYYDHLDYSNYTHALNEIQQYKPMADSSFIEYETILNKMIQEGAILGEHGRYIYKK